MLEHLEDQVFLTVFTCSGLILLGLISVWAAIDGTIQATYVGKADILIEDGFYSFGRMLMLPLRVWLSLYVWFLSRPGGFNCVSRFGDFWVSSYKLNVSQ